MSYPSPAECPRPIVGDFFWGRCQHRAGSAARRHLPHRAAGTGKRQVLVALGIAAVQTCHKVRYFTAARQRIPS